MRHTRQLQLMILRKWRQNERRVGVGGSKFGLCNTNTNSANPNSFVGKGRLYSDFVQTSWDRKACASRHGS